MIAFSKIVLAALAGLELPGCSLVTFVLTHFGWILGAQYHLGVDRLPIDQAVSLVSDALNNASGTSLYFAESPGLR